MPSLRSFCAALCASRRQLVFLWIGNVRMHFVYRYLQFAHFASGFSANDNVIDVESSFDLVDFLKVFSTQIP